MTIVLWATMMLGLVFLAILSYFWLDSRGVWGNRTRVAGSETEPAGAPAPAATTAATFRLEGCPHWSEHSHCGQKCLDKIEATPTDCVVRLLLVKWYQGKICTACGKVFDEADMLKHSLCVMTAEGQAFALKDRPVETIPSVLETSVALCWNCHLPESFRRQFPKLVLDRDKHA